MATIAATLIASLASHAMAEETSVRLAENGAIVPMPAIASMNCRQMDKVIERIDASNYRARGAAVIPQNHPDRPIFDYENALAAAFYNRCTLRQSQNLTPGLAFGRN